MHRAESFVLSLVFGLLYAAACSPVKAPASDSGPDIVADADPAAPDAAVNPEDCGNGQPDPGETCDDGNKNAGDGCSAVCLDESDFCDPKQVGTTYSIGSSAGRMVAEGNTLYVTGLPTINNPTFRVLDVTNPASVGSLGFFNHNASDYPNARVGTLLKRGNIVWLAGSDPGLSALDVSNPGAILLHYLKLNPQLDGHLARIGENHLLVSQSVSETPEVFDIGSNPPTRLGTLGDATDVYYNVGSSLDYGFASTFSNSVDIFSGTGDPTNATVAGRYQHGTAWNDTRAVQEILSEGNLLVFSVKASGAAGGIHIVDIGVPSAPVFKATIPEQPSDIALQGRYLYVPGENGLKVYDLNDAANPALAGSIVNFTFDATQIAVGGGRVYAVSEDKLLIAEGLPGVCAPICGNRTQEYTEACDDGNHDEGDGCSADCSAVN